jgi:hypothetical protein
VTEQAKPPTPTKGFLNPNTPDWEAIAARHALTITRLRTALEQIIYTEDVNPTAYKIARDAIAAVEEKP